MDSKPPTSRPGFSFTGLVVVLAVLASLTAAAWYFLPGFNLSSAEEMPLFHQVRRGEFLHEVAESGEVKSASNVEIRCEVQARGQGGITILEIVPEGTYVQPGDFLVKLDDSFLSDEHTQQKIVCSSSEAAVVKAETDLANAELALKEYVNGTFEQLKEQIESKKAVAEETLRKATDYYEYSNKLAKRGYITKLQLEGHLFAIKKADFDLKAAVTELRVLEEYTKQKMVNELGSNIKTAQANLAAQEATHKLDMQKLSLIESQLEKCTILATQSGQVVYANETNRHGGQEVIIEAGVSVRERQVIIRLPDSKSMQVIARINEANVANVKVGMPVKIYMGTYPDREFDGVVEKVNEYPAPAAWWAGSVKEYETFIKIIGSPEGLKPGLSAEVRILVEDLYDVVTVPVQAVFEHAKKHYCVLRQAGSWTAREVKIGSTNDKVVVVKGGLEPGEQIVLGAFAYRDMVDLPEIPKEPKIKRTALAGAEKNSGTDGKIAQQDVKKTAAAQRPGPPRQGDDGKDPSGGRDIFAELDKNRDGKISMDELPAQMQEIMKSIDSDSNGAVDRSEWALARKKMRARPGGPGPPGAGS